METKSDRWVLAAAKIAIAIMVLVVIVVVVLNGQIAAKSTQSFTNTNMVAPFSALGFLGGFAVFVVGLVVVFGAAISGHKRVARAVAMVAAVEVLLYGALLLGYSQRSQDVLLSAGQEKFFCEIDCHLAYTVTDIKREGSHVTVTLRTRFDERSIAPWRGDAMLYPNPRRVEIVDASRRTYPPWQHSGTDLATPLRPGQSYTTEFAFDVPADARDPRLLVLDAGSLPERVLIGNEKSFLHGKVMFRL